MEGSILRVATTTTSSSPTPGHVASRSSSTRRHRTGGSFQMKPGPIDIHYSIKVELTGCVRIDSSSRIDDLKKAIIALETDRAARLTPEDLKLFYEEKEISEKTDEQPQPNSLTPSSSSASAKTLGSILRSSASNRMSTSFDVEGQLNLPVARPEAFLDTWQVSRDRIVFDKEAEPLGKGSYGTVYKGEMDGTDVAVKVIKLPQKHKREIVESFKKECQILSQLRHTNVLLLMGICVEEDQLLLVTEFMRGGSVHDLLHREGIERPTLLRRLLIARDCCLGMTHMHHQSILHLDLKPQNILVGDVNGPAKIADFGQSEILRQSTLKTALYGTLTYMAPEILQEKEVTTKADVYSFGLLLWELLSLQVPYANKKLQGTEGLGRMIARLEKNPNKRLPLKSVKQAVGDAGGGCVDKLTQIITDCWQTDPAARPSFQQLIGRLDEAIVDVIIPEPNLADARSFWHRVIARETNSHRFAPSWKVFKEELMKFFSLTAIQTPKSVSSSSVYEPYKSDCITSTNRSLSLKPLKKLLLPNFYTSEVALDRFSRLVRVFGPFKENETSFLDKINEAVTVKAFHGFLESNAVSETMSGREVGEYILRVSATSRGYFTLSYVDSTLSGTYNNVRIKVTSEWKYKIKDDDREHVQFDTMSDLARYCEEEYNLTRPIFSDLGKSCAV